MPYSDQQDYQRKMACERYKDAEDVRKYNTQELKNKEVTAVDSPDRVETRRGLVPTNDGFGLERIIGSNNLISINYLVKGIDASRPVCRINIRDRMGRPAGFGTGFMVSPSLLLTNHHVIETVDIAQKSLAEFDFESDKDFIPKPTRLFMLDPGKFYYSHQVLDFALIAVNPRALDGTQLADYGFLSLIPDSGKVLIDEPVSIIQHPQGADKHIALRSNRVLNLLNEFIHYETDTMPGSSGSPVFNDQWQVAALHHSGVPKVNADGKPLTKNNRVWRPEMGEDAIHWIANEGVRISAIFSHLQAISNWSPQQAELLAELDSTQGISQEDLVDNTSSNPQPSAPPKPTPTRPSILTIDEFRSLLDNDETSEADIAPYIEIDEMSSGAFEPLFRLNNDLVIDPSGLESDRVLGWTNSWSRSNRQRRYRRKVAENPNVTRIVSEGDSWFQFPFILNDIVDNIMNDDDFAVFSLGAAGDHLSNMINAAEYVEAIRREQPEFFLISGGGNDLVGGRNLAQVLHPFASGRRPDEYLNPQFDAFVEQIRANYRRLFNSIQTRFPHLKILCHGYDYPIPSNGRWLGQPMQSLGIEAPSLQQEILMVVMDRLNDVIGEVASNFNNTQFLDLRNLVGSGEWFDELHPKNSGFRRVSDVFLSALRNG